MTLEDAIIIACMAHEGQKDKADNPYIFHCIHVMQNVIGGLDYQITAVLHDVLEDSDISIYELKLMGLNEKCCDALICLTRGKKEDYSEYIDRIKTNDIAREVKRADLIHNMDLERLHKITSKDIQRREKYMRAYDILNNFNK